MHRIEINCETGEQIQVELTPDEIAAMAANESHDTRTYIQKRVSEYPPITDYLDGIVKGDQAQVDKYIADCLAVKAKYPK